MSIRELVPFRKKTAIRRWEEPFRSFFDEIEEIFERFFGDHEIEPLRNRWSAFVPRVDFTEDDKEYRITAELPGMDEKDIEVTMDEHSITIRGEKKEDKEDRGKDYFYRERRYGAFTRTIPLPEDVDTEKVEAKFKNGVLTLKLPKTGRGKNIKKIEIKS